MRPRHVIGNEAFLAWVIIDDGTPRHVSEFAHLLPRQRPAAICPVCREPVTFKLGAVNAHHVAHRERASCSVGRGEGAVHLNSKLHLLRQLERASSLRVARHCDLHLADQAVDESMPEIVGHWSVPAWNSVEAELAIGSRRPDLVLLRDGHPVAAVEVVVSHRLSIDKQIDLETHGLPWIEVRGSEDLYHPNTGWTADVPLPIVRWSAALGLPCLVCLDNAAAQAAALERQRVAAIARQEEHQRRQARKQERRRHRVECTHRRVVHLYDATSGGSDIIVYFCERVYLDGQLTHVQLCCGSLVIHSAPNGTGDHAKVFKAALDRSIDAAADGRRMLRHVHEWERIRDASDRYQSLPPRAYAWVACRWQPRAETATGLPIHQTRRMK